MLKTAVGRLRAIGFVEGILKSGAPCSVAEGTSCPMGGCKECIGEVWRYAPGIIPNCLCRDGLWMCVDMGGGGADTTIGDCFEEGPFTCEEAQTLYTDATCTVHPPCTP